MLVLQDIDQIILEDQMLQDITNNQPVKPTTEVVHAQDSPSCSSSVSNSPSLLRVFTTEPRKVSLT